MDNLKLASVNNQLMFEVRKSPSLKDLVVGIWTDGNIPAVFRDRF